MSQDTTEDLFIDDDFDPEGTAPIINVAPGFYHTIIDSAETFAGRNNDSLVAKFRILAGTEADEVGNVHVEHIKMNAEKWPSRKRIALAIAAGLISPAEVKAAKKEGTGLKVDWNLLTGRQVCIEIDHSTNETSGKVYANVAFSNFWAPDSDAAKRIPKDKQSLEIAKTEQNDPFSNPPAVAEAATEEPAPTADDANPFA